VATVLWTTDQILRRLLPDGSRSEWRDATGSVQLCEVHLDRTWFGTKASVIEEITPAKVAFITRLGEGVIPNHSTVLQEGDLVHVIVLDNDLPLVEAALAKSPEAK
jgi:trk system potassium uptake protein TrkA